MAALLGAATAAAHVVVSPDRAPRDVEQLVTFAISHGCDGAATTEIRVQIPYGVGQVAPAQVDGWTVSTETAGDQVTHVSWRGNLPDGTRGEFPMTVKLPDAGLTLFFPATQVCGGAVVEWNEIPAPGASGENLTHPAPRLDVGSAGIGEMDMSNMNMEGMDHSTMDHSNMDHENMPAAPAQESHQH
jgi:uncharacterized protein YcnI